MARALDFRTVKKQFLTLTFNDGNVVLIRSPKLINIENYPEEWQNIEEEEYIEEKREDGHLTF